MTLPMMETFFLVLSYGHHLDSFQKKKVKITMFGAPFQRAQTFLDYKKRPLYLKSTQVTIHQHV